MAAEGLAEPRLGHYSKDGTEVVTVEGETGTCTAPQLRELLIDLASKGSCRLVATLDKAGFPGSAGLGVLAGGLKRVRPHDGSLDLACTQERILKIFKIILGPIGWDDLRTASSKLAAAIDDGEA